jgi:DNA integrity scanning protein DisA with diadenylate cyclase activity
MSLKELLNADTFWAAARPVDLLDVAIVAVALSVVLSWLKRRSTRPLLFAAGIAIAVYALASWLNLYLTLQFFRVGALVLLAAMLLAYQEDLRRGLERLATGQLFRRHKTPGVAEQAVATLTDAAFDLAERRFGALIVVRSIEHLDRHFLGGWSVDGKLSVPLLLSVFDPHTPAHDGAVVIDEDGRLDRIGVHLPLTSNLAALEGRGTRHAAALGLAEVSDALVIVVSEERGCVSVARGDQIEPVGTHEELSAFLQGVFEERQPTKTARRRRFWPRDLEVKAAALALAAALWLVFAAPSEPVQRIYAVPIEFKNVPAGWTLEEPFPAEAEVTLLGPEPRFREVVADELRLTIELPKPKVGPNQVPTEAGTINAPQPLRVVWINPETIFFVARPPGGARAKPSP